MASSRYFILYVDPKPYTTDGRKEKWSILLSKYLVSQSGGEHELTSSNPEPRLLNLLYLLKGEFGSNTPLEIEKSAVKKR